MGDDSLEEFSEYDFEMDSDVSTCPHCGADVSSSMLLGDEIECPECGKRFSK